jgi:rubrerythrin
MGGIKSTKENLEEAIEGETHEYTKMYPQMILEAEKEEGNEQAIQSFDLANKVESIHANLYQKALDNLDNNESVDYYVCQVCGNTVENHAPDKCHVCGAPSSMFTKID